MRTARLSCSSFDMENQFFFCINETAAPPAAGLIYGVTGALGVTGREESVKSDQTTAVFNCCNWA
jgi:hypothetical protein